MKSGSTLVGRVSLRDLESGALVRLDHPPFHVLVSLVNGRPSAIEDACNHAGASLSEGERLGDRVACPMHGYLFELDTGRLMAPSRACGDQRRLIARVVGEDVEVWDPGSATPVVGL